MSDDPQPKGAPFHWDEHALRKKLNRLLESSRANLPALMQARAERAFTLHEDPTPHASLSEADVIVYPQDPFVGGPELRRMPAVDIRPGPSNERFVIRDSAGPGAQPDEDGNYLYHPDDYRFDQINAFYYATYTLRMYERYNRRRIPWSFPEAQLGLDPHFGSGANAFYDEPGRLLGFLSFQQDGQTVHTAQSADIVSHETAHAVLDGLRDLYNESFGLGPNAFHESFGDITAILVAPHDQTLVTRLLEWTKGNLRLGNFIAAMAEQIAAFLGRGGEARGEHAVYLRNALNNFTAQPFDALPYRVADSITALAREPHSYARVFSGAFYELLVGLYELLAEAMSPQVAVERARDIAGTLLVTGVELGPVGEFGFDDMARAMLAADDLFFKGQHSECLLAIFDRRAILSMAEGRAFLEAQHALPEISLPAGFHSTDHALDLLQTHRAALGLPALPDLLPLAAYKDMGGNAYLTFFSQQRIYLSGEAYRALSDAPVPLDLFGGLTLLFDKTGRLRYRLLRHVSEEDVRQVRLTLADMLEHGQIKAALSPDAPASAPLTASGLYLLDDDARPPLGGLARAPDDGLRLVKHPVQIDMIDRSPLPILDFLRTWAEWLRR